MSLFHHRPTLTLPKDGDAAKRAHQLEEQRGRYGYQYAPPLTAIATLDTSAGRGLPAGEHFGLAWLEELAATGVLLINNSRGFLDKHRGHATEIRDALHEDLKPQGGQLMARLLARIQSIMLWGDGAAEDRKVTRATHLDDFDALYAEIALPPIARTYGLKHSLFAHLRVAGANPMQIQGVDRLGDRFPLPDATYRRIMGEGDSLAKAGAEGRLYVTDYAILDGVTGGVFPHGQKYGAAPLAVFAVPQGISDARALAPVAIQLGQRPGPDNPIFTPLDDPWAWRIAKAYLNSADSNVHQVVHHLAHTHLVIEPIVIATHRRLAPEHPVSALLVPHFDGTLAINDAAVHHLIALRGGVDALATPPIEVIHDLVAKSVSTWSFRGSMLHTDLAARRVADVEALPDYPYRDDAILVHREIKDFVAGYLALFYASDLDVQQDPELAAWGAEIVAADGGRIRDFGDGGRFATVADLTDALTHIVFTASAQHAAVNFPQFDLMSYAPVMPMATYRPPPTRKDGLGEEDFFAMLPSIEMAHYQLSLGRLLGGLRHTVLGDRTPMEKLGGSFAGLGHTAFGEHPVDRQVEEVHERFRRRLRELDGVIDVRNTARIGYPYLKPKLIPRSINI
jgi:arachidonate 15-lipoxygenase